MMTSEMEGPPRPRRGRQPALGRVAFRSFEQESAAVPSDAARASPLMPGDHFSVMNVMSATTTSPLPKVSMWPASGTRTSRL